MSDAVAVAVAKAVTSQIQTLNSGLFDLERSYADWSLDLKQTSVLPRVDVVVNSTTQTLDNTTLGGRLGYTVGIDVALRYKFGPADQDDSTGRITLAEIDDLMLMFQNIYEPFPNRLDDMPEAVLNDWSILAAPDKRSLRELRQFTAVARFVYAVDRGYP